MNLNKAELIGNLTADPIIKKLSSDKAYVRFVVATNQTWKDAKTKEVKKESEFHNIVAFGKLAAVVSKYLKKGDKVFISGRLKTQKWQGRQKTEIVADNLIMLGNKPKPEGNDEAVVEEIDN
jgi:single-strand DNA-binding protein